MARRARIRLNSNAQRERERLVKKAVELAAQRTAVRANSNVLRRGRRKTGKLARSFKTKRSPLSTPLLFKVRVYSDLPYTGFQERGTRAHGPVKASRLVFKPKGSQTFVFAKWVRGVKPGNFLSDARRALRPEDFLP